MPVVTHAAVTAGFKWAPDTDPVAYTPIMTLPANADAAMGGPPAYLAAETAPQPPATIVKVPTASAAHLAASEYFGLSSAIRALRRWRRRGRYLPPELQVVLWLVCGLPLAKVAIEMDAGLL